MRSSSQQLSGKYVKLSHVIGSSRELNPSRKICHLRAVPRCLVAVYQKQYNLLLCCRKLLSTFDAIRIEAIGADGSAQLDCFGISRLFSSRNKMQLLIYYRPIIPVVKTLLSIPEVLGSIPVPLKSNTVSPTFRHRCDVSSELCCPGVKPR